MFNLKTFAVAAGLGLASTAAMADPITFGSTTAVNSAVAVSGNTGVWNLSGGSTVAGLGTNAVSTSFSIYDQGGNIIATEAVFEQFNGGLGVATTSVSHAGATYSFTLAQALTISYQFAAPATVLGYSGIDDLLSITFAAGTVVSGTFSNFGFSLDLPSGVFTSDLFGFQGSTEQTASYNSSFFHSSTDSFSATANFSADPYPRIPEAPSAALLIGGLAAVAFVNRRRAA